MAWAGKQGFQCCIFQLIIYLACFSLISFASFSDCSNETTNLSTHKHTKNTQWYDSIFKSAWLILSWWIYLEFGIFFHHLLCSCVNTDLVCYKLGKGCEDRHIQLIVDSHLLHYAMSKSFLSPPSVPAHSTPVAATISSNWFTRDVVPAISRSKKSQNK